MIFQNLPKNIQNEIIGRLSQHEVNLLEQSQVPRQYYSENHRQSSNRRKYPNPRRVIDPGNLVFYKNGPYQRKWNLGIINKVRNPNGPTNYYNNEPILNSLSAIGRQFGSKLIPKREGIRNSTTRQTVQSYQSRITPSVRRTIKKLKPGETYKTRLPGNSRKAP